MGVKFPGRVEDSWQCPSMKAATRFADRAPESEALRESLRVHRRAIDSDGIDGETMNNILVFYGVGGVGKSTLSEHLEAWITGKLPADFHWGEPPTGLNVATVRWDLRSEQQLTSPVPFYLNLRRALAQAGFATPIFDVGVAVLGARFKTSVAHEGDHYAELADDLAAEVLRDALSEAPAMTIEQQAAGLRPGRYLLSQVSDPAVLESLVRIHTNLPVALKTVLRGEASVDRLKEAAQMVGWMLSEDIQRRPAADRPLPVMFLDTFEKLRNRTLTRDEEVVNSVVGALPYCLFVVTGRLMVGWADPKAYSLEHAGPATWPSLARTRASEPEPRQHLVGTLDEEDARDVLEYCMADIDAPFEDDLIANLAATTQLPEHIDATAILARRFALANPGQTLTLADLGGSFKDVVERLMGHLSPQEAQLLQAAATTPQFDIPLVAAMAQVPYAVAEHTVNNPLVQKLAGQDYFPHHLHDEIRRLVKEAGPEVRHAWTAQDRHEATQRGLDHLEGRLKEAIKEDVFEPRFAIHALGYRLAADHGIDSEWVATEFSEGPSQRQTARLIPHAETDPQGMLLQARLNAIIVLPSRDRLSCLQALLEEDLNREIALDVRRWLAYSYRNIGRNEIALGILEDLSHESPSRVHHSQVIITLRMMRRYRDAVRKWLAAGDDLSYSLGGLYFAEGHLGETLKNAEVRIEEAVARGSSRRWVADLQNYRVQYRAWLGLATDGELRKLGTDATVLDQLGGIATSWRWLAMRHLYDDSLVEEYWRQLTLVRNAAGAVARSASLAMIAIAGFRLLALGDSSYVGRVSDYLDLNKRINSVPLEFLWEYLHDLGLVESKLPAVEPDWVGDREEIKQRWITIFHRLIEEARERSEGHVDE